MQSYIYPKLLREEMHADYADNPTLRSKAVNEALLKLSTSDLASMGMRRARQKPRVPYEPFGVAITDDALHVLRSLPPTVSRSALIQSILR
ncbi:hypothetical protein A6M27_02655 [Acidithiobacillus thiooxidans]|uniref:Uncharacterized protein n=1 Tax=Acidithiobacillus thiooxidans TaxID=930 RepID=A0A1C2I6V3_ACITH|nr:hypothetical protein [Acidithiobacillus thiooxidans]OCX71657.1 hypothetical protein A6O24_15180 [Acidithiobacillus thiooxidans]OCX76278.1 hypothetical protein A6P07_02995 [Acidithiobacillus thiooxidans]OCX78470.1 hypothetical protein A6O26_17965 [Acidithiobacillus thiooxidans]OCX89251.1 hypothetical protein A6M27_02655 [Acidithiobacillus thiooxidans]OFC42633.1 hypothetical protein BAE47_14905 [Acidithiobacillus thiooxidans]